MRVICNAAFAKLCGKATADLPGAPWAALWLTDAPTGDESSLTRLPQGKTRETIELARAGHWFRLLVDPVLEADAVAGFVCIATDITVERQGAEARAPSHPPSASSTSGRDRRPRRNAPAR